MSAATLLKRQRDAVITHQDDDGMIAISKATKLPALRRSGHGPHLATLLRWATVGVRGCKLRTRLVGGRRFTRSEWVDEFLAALNEEVHTPAGQLREARHATEEMDVLIGR